MENHRRLVSVQNFCNDCMKCVQLGLASQCRLARPVELTRSRPSSGADLIPTVIHNVSPLLQTDEQHQGYVREYVGVQFNHFQSDLQPQLNIIHNYTHINLSTMEAADYL